MKKWKHLSLDQRKVINSGIASNRSLRDIALSIGYDPTSISKEVKRNRVKYTNGLDAKNCPKLNRWPHVCSGCNKRYGNQCSVSKYRYNPNSAQSQADYNLVASRSGIDVTEEEFKTIDNLIKEGIEEKKSIYQIKIENKDEINKSVVTLYRYINKGYLTTKRIDLPYAVRYKKRKYKKKYEYTDNKIDRSNHTYVDYLAHIHQNPGVYVWQLDFLGAIRTDNNNILSLILPDMQFCLLDIVCKPNSEKVVRLFDSIENKIGIDVFKEVFPVILTDRDPSFSDIEGICFSKITGEERCKLFFCDPYVSNQKPNVENLNKQLRMHFPKGTSVDRFKRKDIININKVMLNRPLRSLDSFTPKDAFIKVFDKDIFGKLIK